MSNFITLNTTSQLDPVQHYEWSHYLLLFTQELCLVILMAMEESKPTLVSVSHGVLKEEPMESTSSSLLLSTSLLSTSSSLVPSSSGARSSKAFWPERSESVGVKANTVLTNLQRGNIPTMQTIVMEPVVYSLHQRAGQGELEAGELDGAAVDERDGRGRTPLMWASFYGQTPTVSLILRHGAHVDAVDEAGVTALHLASGQGHHDIVRALLNAGAYHDAEDENVCTPLFFAAINNHPHCVNELVMRGANVAHINLDGDTAISLAIVNGSAQAQAVLEQKLVAILKNALNAN